MSLDFNEGELLQIIRALNINRAYGHDDISIRMIKICDKSLLKPLTVLLRNSIKSSCYPDIWKTSNIIPVHKRNDKQLVENYPPISLLPIFGKIFEKIIFNRIYNFLLEEDLLNPNRQHRILPRQHRILSSGLCCMFLRFIFVFVNNHYYREKKLKPTKISGYLKGKNANLKKNYLNKSIAFKTSSNICWRILSNY